MCRMQGPVLGEFLGTMVLLTFGCGCVANVLLAKSKGQGAGWVSINFGWAMAVVFGVFTATATGSPQADINPAVTLFKTLAGVYDFSLAITLMIAQLAGAFCGAVIVYLIYLPHWELTEDKGAKLGIFSTGPAVRNIPRQLHDRVHRHPFPHHPHHVRFLQERWGDNRWPWPISGGHAGLRHRRLPGRSHRIRHQPCP